MIVVGGGTGKGLNLKLLKNKLFPSDPVQTTGIFSLERVKICGASGARSPGRYPGGDTC